MPRSPRPARRPAREGASRPRRPRATVRSGLDVLAARRFGPLRRRTVGLVCNPTAVTRDLVHAADLLHAAPGVRLAALFGPEHGVRGDAQYMAAVGGERDPRHRAPGAASTARPPSR